jgi:hypothetical protein
MEVFSNRKMVLMPNLETGKIFGKILTPIL